MSNFRLYISPFFLSHIYIQKDIKKFIKKYKFKGKILDYGCGQKPHMSLFTNASSYIGIDFKNYSLNKDFPKSKPDYFFTLSFSKKYRLPFKSTSFDHCVAFQVLEHHRNPSKMVSEMVRVVRPGGYLLITVPFLAEVHEKPNDFQRLTRYGLLNLLKNQQVNIRIIKEEGGLFSVISLLINSYLTYLSTKSKIFYAIVLLIYPIFLIYSYIAFALDKIVKSKDYTANYFVVAQKKYEKF